MPERSGAVDERGGLWAKSPGIFLGSRLFDFRETPFVDTKIFVL